jgi:hypothetical protein
MLLLYASSAASFLTERSQIMYFGFEDVSLTAAGDENCLVQC